MIGFPGASQEASVVLPIDTIPVPDFKDKDTTAIGQNLTTLLEPAAPLTAAVYPFADDDESFARLSAQEISDSLVESTDDIVTRLPKNTTLLQSDIELDTSDALTQVADLGDVLQTYGSSSTQISLRFEWAKRDAFYNNEVGVFVLDDVLGTVQGLRPGDVGYAEAVLTHAERHVLFSSGEAAGAWRELEFQGSTHLGFYLIQNSSLETWLTQNPQNLVGNGPVAFFSVNNSNPDGFDHVQSQEISQGVWQFKWEDMFGGGDQDFNDVVFIVSEPGVRTPGSDGQVVPGQITLKSASAQFANEMGFFYVDDAKGRIGTLNPGDSGYAAAALSSERSSILFAQGQTPGSVALPELKAGQYLGWYLIQNATTADFLSQNPDNQPGQGPLAFFSNPGANPDGLSHVHFVGANTMAWEDASDRDSDDLIFEYEFEPAPEILSGSTPTLSVGNISITEGNSGSKTATLQVELSASSTETVTVDFSTDDDSALAGSDYEAVSGSLNFAPGETIKEVPIAILGDLFREEEERFKLVLKNPKGASLLGETASITIVDNDASGITVSALLVNDTGIRDDDGITADPTVTGAVSDIAVTKQLFANFVDGQPTDITGLLQSDGSFLLSQKILQGINGGTLPDGEYQFQLQAIDRDDQASDVFTLPFLLDTTAPDGPNLILASEYGANNETFHGKVTVDGQTEADVLVELQDSTSATVSDNEGQLSFTNLALEEGTNQFTAFATDSAGNKSSGVIDVRKIPLPSLRNTAPVITSTPQTAFTLGSDDYQYQVEATDADTDPLTYSLVSGPAGMTIDGSTGLIAWSPAIDDLGEQTVSVIVSDDKGGTATQTFAINVVEDISNNAPTIVSTPVTTIDVTQDIVSYQYDVNATDPDDDALIYSLFDAPVGMDIDSVTGVINWQPEEIAVGEEYSVTIQVSDGKGETDTQTFLLKAENQNQAPVFVSNPLTNFSVPLPSSASGQVIPDFLNLSLGENETFFGSVSITLPEQGDLGGSADVVLIVDESGSMAGEHEWLTDMVLELDTALEARGITNNRYSLLGFAGSSANPGVRNITLPAQPNIQIYGPGNQLVDSVSPSPAPAQIALPSDGDYTVVLEASGAGRLDYDLQVNLVSDVPITPDGFGKVLSQTIAPEAVQTFDFEASAGLSVWFDSINSTSRNIQATLLSPSGKIITTLRSDRDAGPFSLPESGIYTLRMHGGTEGGEYSFQLLNMTDAAAIELDSPISLDIAPGTSHVFQLDGRSGQLLYFDAINASSRGRWSVYDSTNALITGTNVLRNDLAVILPNDGTYRLVVQGDDAEQISHTFQVITPEIQTSIINFSETISSSITEAGEADIYQFTGQAGQGIWLDGLFSQSIFGPNVQLFNPDGQLVLSTRANTDVGLITLSSTGTYSLVVGGSDIIGDYSFQILTTADAPVITSGEVVSSTLNSGHSTLYRIEGVAGQRVQFDTLSSSSQFFSNWKLYSPGHAQVLQNNRQVNNELADDFEVIIPADGTYYLILSNNRSETVEHSFQVTARTEPDSPLTGFGVVNSGSLAATDTASYTFQSAAGTRIWLDALGATDRGIRANLIAPNGDPLLSNLRLDSIDPQPYVLETSGLYTLRVDGGTNGGNYSFRLLDWAMAAPLSLDIATDLSLAPLNTELYQFEGTAGSRLFFDLEQTSSFGGNWGVFYPGSGQSDWVRLRPDDDFTLTLPADGQYILAIRNNLTSTADLRFQIVTREIQTTAIEIGEVVNGTLSAVGAVERYTFTGSQGQKIWIDSLLESADDIDVRVISPTGSLLFDDTRRLVSPTGIQGPIGDQPLNQDTGPITLTENGLYTVQVTGGDVVGNYSFRLLDVATLDTLTDGTSLANNFTDANETQFFQVQGGIAGQTLIISPDADVFFNNVGVLSQDTERLLITRGGTEDGYAGLNSALELPFRDNAVPSLILVTDEDRDNSDVSLTFDSIRNSIFSQDAFLNTIVNAQLEDDDNVRALGIDADGNAYLQADSGNFTLSQGGRFVGSPGGGDTGTIESDYVDLARAVDGVIWDLNQLRAGGDVARSFTNAFVDIQADGISDKFQIDVVSADATVSFVNVTGPLSDLGAGDTANFDIEITGNGEAESFELLFTRPENGFVLGSVPVILNQQYQYPALAIDPDGDSLTYSLLQGPDDATLNSETGAIIWNPPAVGSYEFSIQASDGNGGVAVQEFSVVVNAINSDNQAPIITSTPSAADIDTRQTLTYDVDATDPDGDTLSYYLNSGPSGIQIDKTTGELSWSPTDEQAGIQTIEILVLDGKGKQATQSFEVLVNVAEPNLPPRFDSAPSTVALTSELYQYQPVVTDPEGDTLTYSLRQQPDGMTLDAVTGLVTWQPDYTDIGQYNVVLVVQDSARNETRQTFQLTVSNEPIKDTQAPELQLAASNSVLTPGDSVTLQIRAVDDVDLTSLSLELAGNPLTLIPNVITNGQVYEATAQLSAPGLYTLVGQAVDSSGNIANETLDLRVVDPLDTDSPEITLDVSDLIVGEPISSPYDIKAVIDEPNLEFYRVEYAPTRLIDLDNVGEDDPDYTLLFEGTTLPDSGVLATLDPRFINNDNYFIRVIAQDINGNADIEGFIFDIATENKVGNFTLDATDITIPLTGIPISINRRYDTLRSADQASLGFGWDLLGIDAKISESVAVTDMPGASSFTATPFTYGTRVTLTKPDGERVGFSFTPEVSPGLFGAIWRPKFTPDPGVDETLEVDNVTLQQNSDGTFRLYLFGFPWNPSAYRLTTKDNLTYTYDQFEGLQTVEDLNGNVLTYTDEGIFSSTGDSVRFTYDEQERITSITDPSGNSIRYTYDSNGDLTGVTDQAGNTTLYVYDPNRPHYLVEEIDPLGRSSVRTEYDDQGRISRIIDAEGNALDISIDFDGPTDTQVITDPLGNQTILTYDEQGNVIQEVDAEGGITRYDYSDDNRITRVLDPLGNATSYTYDERGNLLTETDALSNSTIYTYNELNQVLTTTDALGNTTTNRYDERGNLLESEDAVGNTTTYGYDSQGNLEKVTDTEGRTTDYTYDGLGRVNELVDATGGVTTFNYDNTGDIQSLTTPLGNTTTFGYDGAGQLIRITDAKDNITQIQYNAAGERAAVIAALGQRTTYTYNERGLLEATEYPDGTSEINLYDANDRRIGIIDRAGRETTFIYDKLGRLSSTLYPDATPDDDSDNPRTRREYDAAGRLVAFIDENGNRTEYGYDAAGRRILERDALGFETLYTYDVIGNLIALTDALNQQTLFSYDALSQLQQTTYADGTTTRSVFDDLGRIIQEIDQNGITTNFAYDGLDRLTAVTDALGNTTEYTYDVGGNLIRQTDALGRVTAYAYDVLNQRISTQLPLGQVETYTYDPLGNLSTVVDFNGQTITYTYDSNNLLIEELFADGSQVNYTYTPNLLRASVTDARGTTNYSYDERDRLTTQVNPDSSFLNYSYDLAGNRTGLATPSGTLNYSYDALNRISTVTDRQGGITSYAYDSVGNLIQTILPNGVIETRTYNAVDNLTLLEQQNDSDVFARYAYALDPTGRRLQVQELDGRTVDYTYDSLYRLLEEAITDPTLGNRQIAYTYDVVGNRLTRNDSAEGVKSYIYDDNDRLVSSTLGGQTTSYTYDDNGNTLSKTDATGTTTYTWDDQNRLTGMLLPDGTIITYQYDADSNRVTAVVNGQEIRFLVDGEEIYAQIVEEYEPDGTVQATYTFGNDLISQNQAGQETYQHGDGQGSVQDVTDADGESSDEITYDAFGRVLSQNDSGVVTHQYTGEQFDEETGITYLRARYYDSNNGRFLSQDPFEGFSSRPLTHNRYSYAENDTPNKVDPSGNLSTGYAQLLVPAKIIASTATRALLVSTRVTAAGTIVVESYNEFGLPIAIQASCNLLTLASAIDVGSLFSLDEQIGCGFGGTILQSKGGKQNIRNEYTSMVTNSPTKIPDPCQFLRDLYNDTKDKKERLKIKAAMKNFNCDNKNRY